MSRPCRLPRHWSVSVKAAILHSISLAQYALAYTHGWAADSRNARVRLKAQLDRAIQEIALLREDIRIKDARMGQLAPQRRPHYPPVERLAILELKAARGWSLRQAAAVLQITAATVASWLGRLSEDGPEALVQLRQPVNRFPDYVAHLVQQLRTFCPLLRKRKIAAILARAGLHLGTTSVARMLQRKPGQFPPSRDSGRHATTPRVVTAKYPGHLWHIDLTTVPTLAGFTAAWFPFTLPQQWPFCWWVALVVDHYSRRLMGFAAYRKQPTSEQIRAFLGRTMATAPAAPRHLVCDKGPQFWCQGFRRWCRRRGIKPRFGAIGQHGSIAVVERLILSVKLLLAGLPLVPLSD